MADPNEIQEYLERLPGGHLAGVVIADSLLSGSMINREKAKVAVTVLHNQHPGKIFIGVDGPLDVNDYLSNELGGGYGPVKSYVQDKTPDNFLRFAPVGSFEGPGKVVLVGSPSNTDQTITLIVSDHHFADVLLNIPLVQEQ